MMKATCKRVNKALIEAGFDGVELVNSGVGYFYFWALPTHQSHWLDQYISLGGQYSVMVPRVSDLTIEQWVEELKTMCKTWSKMR